MRPLLAFLTIVVILGGLQLYMRNRPSRPEAALLIAETAAQGQYSLDITLTFDAGPDPFALDPDAAPSLLVLLRGAEVLRREDAVATGAVITVSDVQGLVQGANEFFVVAAPQDRSQPVARAVRVRVLRNGQPLAEQTIWSEPGEIVEGTVVVEIPDWVELDRESTGWVPATTTIR